MQNVGALRSYAVYVVAYFGKTTVFERAHLVFHEFFESVPGQLLILDVIGLVLFCDLKKNCTFHISVILKDIKKVLERKIVENFIFYKIVLVYFCRKSSFKEDICQKLLQGTEVLRDN